MTTIAFDGRTLAADTMAVSGGYLKRRVEKLFRLKDGSLFGGAGELDSALKARDWLDNPDSEKPKLDDNFTGVLITPEGAFRLESALIRMPIFESFHAIGSGRDFALAAMYLGKTAQQAIELAMVFDANSGGEIMAFELHNPSAAKMDGNVFWLAEDGIKQATYP